MTNNNITEEMIEAGRQAYTDWQQSLDPRTVSLGEAIYTAMQAASQPPVTMDGLVDDAELQATIESLKRRITTAATVWDREGYRIAYDAITTLLATIERQREALEPFAEAYRQAEPWREFEGRDCRELCVINAVSLSDFEAASKALESQP